MDLFKRRLNKCHQDWQCFVNMGMKFRRLFRDERKLACFYLATLPKRRGLAFDIGANRGNYSKVLGSLFERVIALEPQQRLLPEIRRNIRRFGNIELVNCAVSDHEGTAPMFLSMNHELSSLNRNWMQSVQTSGRFSDIRWDETVEVPTTTLKQLVQKFGVPDFIKIDTEGNERKVLTTLDCKVPLFSLEIIPENNTETLQIINHLESIAPCSYNLALGEEPCWAFAQARPAETVISFLRSTFSPPAWADLYVQMV